MASTEGRYELDDDERDLLVWLGKEDFSQYGECSGRALDSLVGKGLVEIHQGSQHQAGFIAKGSSLDHQAVSLTAVGQHVLKYI